jgi:hypothetical protein
VATAGRDVEILWWREGDREVDIILAGRSGVLAIEVGSGRPKPSLPAAPDYSPLMAAQREPRRRVPVSCQLPSMLV